MGLTWCDAVWFGVMLGLMRGLVGLRAAHNQLGGSIPCVTASAASPSSRSRRCTFSITSSTVARRELSLAELGQLPALVELELQENKMGEGGRAAVALHLCEPH